MPAINLIGKYISPDVFADEPDDLDEAYKRIEELEDKLKKLLEKPVLNEEKLKSIICNTFLENKKVLMKKGVATSV
jgi:hypothetical protein